MSLEHLFSTSILSLSVPNTSVEFPPSEPCDEWLQTLDSNAQERGQAFFDEQLQSLLTLRVEHPTEEPADPSKPPAALISFLAHVQVSLEASYISSVPASAEIPQTSRLSAPPRTASLGLKLSARIGPHHPSILPPNTPNPTPATADHDRKYVAAQGTPLFNSIWGQGSSDSQEDFALIWSEQENLWVAIYRLAVTVSYLRLNFADPLLCLTVSATLREKPVTTSSTQHPFIRFLKSYDGIVIPESPTITEKGQTQQQDDTLEGFEEVNLLEGLLAGPTFSKIGPSEINLPSTRLGIVSRQKMFALPPINLPTPTTPSPSPMTATRGKVHPTLRKSYRKTLQTVSGFRVRMRTVFVPSVVLNASQEEHDKMTSGNEERTVVLCVEIENSGESDHGVGFEVEKVDVAISGDEAKATLITWGAEGFATGEAVFPLKLAQWAQYNLLYAVTFLRSPQELDAFSFARSSGNHAHSDLQRAVTINIFGKPYVKAQGSTVYPTQTFSSKWNCVLDLASRQTHNLDSNDPSSPHPNVLPEPPSPFPVFSLQTSKPSPTHGSAVDSAKTRLMAGRIIKTSSPRFSSIPMSANTARFSTPQLGGPGQFMRSPTTYGAPPPPPDHDRSYPGPLTAATIPPAFDSPMTPAYPAFPSKSAIPPTPMFQAPVISQSSAGIIGPSLEARRNRGSLMEPPTAVPYHQDGGTFANEQQKIHTRMYGTPENNDAVVVSVGLSSVIQGGGISSKVPKEEALELGPGKIFPLDSFTLDIFVFNKSDRTRRFEVSCLERRRRRRGGEENGVTDVNTGAGRKMGYPGIMPMEGRVRIGPLLPSACQSVRMEFLAVSPGVHSIEALTLMDIESGYSINLRYAHLRLLLTSFVSRSLLTFDD
ncbi:hypothetical protein P691DRAFT_722685 [Macrolepiota fuliginosa MF-IS2]|uniref:Trafficking protein particle complex II-specific subunit 65 IgD3 domain-containing protein n=1 Tax=Macrolepiota fuliginosa MF-IS2 TaxID=1400762 RepID=A0A9P5XLX3_9AGAR|nr:hypothetical protein P691DRAFT_722685 [Macrolepiota fuliginosa MF-IS2]